jgi:hypothetical protein
MARTKIATTQDLISDLQIKCIGLIAGEWSLLEATMAMMIWALCGLDRKRGHCVTSEISSLAKIKMLSSLMHVHLKPYKQAASTLREFDAIVGELELLNTERNTVVHGIWFQDDQGHIHTKKIKTRSGDLKESSISKTDEWNFTVALQLPKPNWTNSDKTTH